MRKTYVQINGELIEKDAYRAMEPTGPMIMNDIQPYQSMVDGSMITSRSQHREHLKQHGMIEIGNEINHHMKQPERTVDREGIRHAIAQSLDQHRR